jgi:hypothetical protein
MDAKGLNKALIALVEKKNQLSNLNYADTSYDTVEEELHDLEDKLIDKYGKELEQALEEVHDEHCSDTEVLLPIAYIAQKYIHKGQLADGSPVYDVSFKEGVWVDADGFPGKEARLVILPSPARIVLMVAPDVRKEVWRAS